MVADRSRSWSVSAANRVRSEEVNGRRWNNNRQPLTGRVVVVVVEQTLVSLIFEIFFSL